MDLQEVDKERWTIRSEFDVIHNGRTWHFWAAELNEPGLTTRLDEEILLDWHDILHHPETTRMHMYAGANRQDPFSVKQNRMEEWVASIQTYDSMMEDRAQLTKAELLSMLESHKLPRPKEVVLDTGSVGLRKLFTTLGFREDLAKPNPFVAPWDEFVLLAKSGKLLATWLEQKKKGNTA